VKSGEICAVLGRNGVGKTTLMKYIAGIISNERGEVRLEGKCLPKSVPLRARAGIAYLPQGREIFPRLTTTENIEVAARACGKNPKAIVPRLFEMFPILGERCAAKGGNLSGGQQQILAIARALATEPKVIILDEPTEGIQPSIIDQIYDILEKLKRLKDVSMLIAEQNLDFVTGLANVSYIMDHGKIVREVAIEELRKDRKFLHEMLGV
jgi:ABC-type branched-subunit amino acid transport system ATPase component